MAVWKPGITAQIKENKNSAVEIPGLAPHEDRNYGTRQEKAIWCRNIAGQEPLNYYLYIGHRVLNFRCLTYWLYPGWTYVFYTLVVWSIGQTLQWT